MKFGYTIIYVAEVAASVDFYERAFGLKTRFISPDGSFAELETGATALGFADERFVAESIVKFTPNRAEESPAGIEIGFVVAEEELEAAYARALAAGAVAVLAPARKPWGQLVSYLRDLNGVLVEICGPVAPPPT